MTARKMVETDSEWLQKFAFEYHLPIDAPGDRMYVRYGDLTLTAPLSRILGGEKPASDEKDAA